MPGPATAMILDTTIARGRKMGFLTALGGSVGVAFYALLAVLVRRLDSFASSHARDAGRNDIAAQHEVDHRRVDDALEFACSALKPGYRKKTVANCRFRITQGSVIRLLPH